MGLYPVARVLRLITHNTQITHITQNYINNEGHTTHSEYNANTIRTTTNTLSFNLMFISVTTNVINPNCDVIL
jgi:hypothetical protein